VGERFRSTSYADAILVVTEVEDDSDPESRGASASPLPNIVISPEDDDDGAQARAPLHAAAVRPSPLAKPSALSKSSSVFDVVKAAVKAERGSKMRTVSHTSADSGDATPGSPLRRSANRTSTLKGTVKLSPSLSAKNQSTLRRRTLQQQGALSV
jgi:hypothetical protein